LAAALSVFTVPTLPPLYKAIMLLLHKSNHRNALKVEELREGCRWAQLTGLGVTRGSCRSSR
jgi:hypothetical protein